MMLSAFWDAREIVYIDEWQNGRMIDWEYYVTLFHHWSKEIQEKFWLVVKNKIAIHQETLSCLNLAL